MICTFTSLHCSFIFNSSIHPENPNFIEWSYVELHILCCLFVQINPNPSPKFIIYLTPVTGLCEMTTKMSTWPQATHPMAHLTFSCSGGFG